MVVFLWLFAVTSVYGVTFNVTVPEGTKVCYVVGNFNEWSVSTAREMEKISKTHFRLDAPDISGSEIAYKYICKQDWDYVEETESGGYVDNRETVTAMDVVGSWKNSYNPYLTTIEPTTSTLPHNIQKKKIKILVPDDYEDNPDKYYPVIYIHGVNQSQYHRSSSDYFREDFFDTNSWNLSGFMEDMEEAGKESSILVGIYGYVGEFTPWENPEFLGSGATDQYLNFFINELMPLIEKDYRVSKDRENTILMGADLGGLFSYYAALAHPEKFGKAGIFSPSFWINKSELETYINQWNKTYDQQLFFGVGGLEGIEYTENTELFYNLTKARGFSDENIRFKVYPAGKHKEVFWKNHFRDAYLYFIHQELPAQYQYMTHSDENGITCEGNRLFEPVGYYPSGTGTPEEAVVYINEIPLDFLPAGETSKNYNWGINMSADCTGNELVHEQIQPIALSNTRTSESWSRIVIGEGNTISCTQVSPYHFKVRTGNLSSTDQLMELAEGNPSYVLVKEVNFDSDKTFHIRYGNINSGSDMGSLTDEITVPANCAKAKITYCFKTNEISIEVLEESYPEKTYILTAGTSASDMKCNEEDMLEKITYYPTGAEESAVEAQVLIKNVSKDIKSNYYWNLIIGDDCSATDTYYSSTQSVGFKSSKTTDSWIRFVMRGNELEKIDTSSEGFKIHHGSNTINMTKSNSSTGEDAFTVSADVEFPSSNKMFNIHYGSINSQSPMGALTGYHQVSDNCLKARISFSLKTNKVSITELEWGEPAGNILSYFQATPAFCKVGTPVTIKAKLANPENYSVTFDVSFTYGTATSYPATRNEAGEFVLELTDVKLGIYHVSMKATQGNNTIFDFPVIAIKVPYENTYEDTDMAVTVNAYKDINWEIIGKYKGNFHTHTSQSFDARSMSPDYVVDRYHSKGYQILAITDHDDNTYPWTMFNSFDPDIEIRNPEELGMLAFPAIELSKDIRNNWSETGGGEYNHHNDFFTGRRGQEFLTLEESYAYTQELGGLQLINHPGQYWKLQNDYSKGGKDSPDWHANNFRKYRSLIGLEVYNQGDKWVNDRILWDQILDRTMPETPVWGYSNDDSHNDGHHFRNYQFMLMEELSIPALKKAMKNGSTYFSYEPGGSGEALAPRINNVIVDENRKTITIDTPADEIYWICSTDISGGATTRKSTVIGYGKTFSYEGFQGPYVRAFIKNEYGETCTQPFGFGEDNGQSTNNTPSSDKGMITVYPNPTKGIVKIQANRGIGNILIVNFLGQVVKTLDGKEESITEIDLQELPNGAYIAKINVEGFVYNHTVIISK